MVTTSLCRDADLSLLGHRARDICMLVFYMLQSTSNEYLNRFIKVFMQSLKLAIGAVLAYLCHLDY